ncbi:MAG TPA: phytanoyl-CoA dioxygenase family protein [Abditibacterium sp.]|jgi:ectoine hydroxylase-related dioxygenase (phytanoyl-CoA dioxygenase family)
MSFPFNEAAIPGRHHLSYTTLDSHRGNPQCDVEVLATESEIQDLLRDGYLVRERIVTGEALQRLRDALDEVMATDAKIETGRETFSGSYARFLHDKHPAFLDLHDFPPALSVARAVLGPILHLRVFTGRLTRPGDAFSEVEWHLHQRMIPRPLPPVWCRPQTLDCLLYLDDLDAGNGPLSVLPGSHEWLDSNLSAFDCEPREGEVTLELPAGSMVMMFGSLWHRALPTDGSRTRRLLLFAYAPAWLKGSIVGEQPANGLSRQLLAQPDVSVETRELLGVAGWL